MTDTLFVIWSIEHDAWWGPNECGYTTDLTEAGVYNEAESAGIVRRGNFPPGTFHECRIPVACVVRMKDQRGEING